MSAVHSSMGRWDSSHLPSWIWPSHPTSSWSKHRAVGFSGLIKPVLDCV